MSPHKPSGRAGSAFKHGLTSRLAVKAWEEEERHLAEALAEGAPATLGVREAARDLASVLLHLRQLQGAKSETAGRLGLKIRVARRRKKPPPDCFDGMSNRTLINLIHEYDDRGAFQLPDINTKRKAVRQHPKPPPQQSDEVDQKVEAPSAAKPLKPDELEEMLRWILARQEEVLGDQEMSPRQIFCRRRLESELYDLVESRRRDDPTEETKDVTLEETLEELRRLDDYERRALSRRKKAIRRLDYEILEARRHSSAA